MTDLSFEHTIPYRQLQGMVLPAPAVTVRLSVQDYIVDILGAVVDTGAERTLLDGAHLRPTDVDLFDGAPVPLRTLLGGRSMAYEHSVSLEVLGLRLDLKVAFSTQPLERELLGRDLLAHLMLGLREQCMELYLTPEPLVTG